MRLDEWQKYIDSEFLEGAARPKPADADGTVIALSERNIVVAAPVESGPAEQEAIPASAEQAAAPGPGPLENAVREQSRTAEPASLEHSAAEPGQPLTPEKPGASRPPLERSTAELPIATGVQASPLFLSTPASGLEIPSFGKYLPAAHPAHEPEEAAGAPVGKPAPQTTSELSLSAGRAEPVAPAVLADPQSESPTVQRTLAALRALEQLYRGSLSDSGRGSDRDSQHRRALIERLLDPVLTLEETAILLQVCPTTVRRYTNRGLLACHRRGPEKTHETPLHGRETRHRRFQLSDVVRFLDTQKSALDEDRKSERRSAGRATPPSAGIDPMLEN